MLSFTSMYEVLRIVQGCKTISLQKRNGRGHTDLSLICPSEKSSPSQGYCITDNFVHQQNFWIVWQWCLAWDLFVPDRYLCGGGVALPRRVRSLFATNHTRPCRSSYVLSIKAPSLLNELFWLIEFSVASTAILKNYVNMEFYSSLNFINPMCVFHSAVKIIYCV